MNRPIFLNWEEQDNPEALANGGSNNFIFRPIEESEWYCSFSPGGLEDDEVLGGPTTGFLHYRGFPFNPKDRMLTGDHRKAISEAYDQGGDQGVLEYIESQEDKTPEEAKSMRKLLFKMMGE